MNNIFARAFRKLTANTVDPEHMEEISPFGSQRISKLSAEERRQQEVLGILGLADSDGEEMPEAAGKGTFFIYELKEGVTKALEAGAKRKDVSFCNELLNRLPESPAYQDIVFENDRMIDAGWRMSPVDRHLMNHAKSRAEILVSFTSNNKKAEPTLQNHIDNLKASQKPTKPQRYTEPEDEAPTQPRQADLDPKRIWDRPAHSAIACLIPMMGLDKLQAQADKTADTVQDIARAAKRTIEPNPKFREAVVGHVAEIEGTPLNSPEAIIQTHAKACSLLASANAHMGAINRLADDYHDQLSVAMERLDEVCNGVEETVAQMTADFPRSDQMEVTRVVDDVMGPRTREYHRVAEEIEEYRAGAKTLASIPLIEEVVEMVEDRARREQVKLPSGEMQAKVHDIELPSILGASTGRSPRGPGPAAPSFG